FATRHAGKRQGLEKLRRDGSGLAGRERPDRPTMTAQQERRESADRGRAGGRVDAPDRHDVCVKGVEALREWTARNQQDRLGGSVIESAGQIELGGFRKRPFQY